MTWGPNGSRNDCSTSSTNIFADTVAPPSTLAVAFAVPLHTGEAFAVESTALVFGHGAGALQPRRRFRTARLAMFPSIRERARLFAGGEVRKAQPTRLRAVSQPRDGAARGELRASVTPGHVGRASLPGPDDVAGANAPEYRPGLDAGRREPGPHAPHGRRADEGDGTLALLVGLRVADGEPAGSVELNLEVGDIEGRDFGDPQHGVGGERDDGGVTEAREGVAFGERRRGVRLLSSNARGLAAAAVAPGAPEPGEDPAGGRTVGGGLAREAGPEPGRGEDLGSLSRASGRRRRGLRGTPRARSPRGGAPRARRRAARRLNVSK